MRAWAAAIAVALVVLVPVRGGAEPSYGPHRAALGSTLTIRPADASAEAITGIDGHTYRGRSLDVDAIEVDLVAGRLYAIEIAHADTCDPPIVLHAASGTLERRGSTLAARGTGVEASVPAGGGGPRPGGRVVSVVTLRPGATGVHTIVLSHLACGGEVTIR